MRASARAVAMASGKAAGQYAATQVVESARAHSLDSSRTHKKLHKIVMYHFQVFWLCLVFCAVNNERYRFELEFSRTCYSCSFSHVFNLL